MAADDPGELPGREASPGRPAGRSPIGRGDRARSRVLRAALEVLAAEGLSGLTMEAVARRAGASKATLYRRWPSRSALLVEAMSTAFEPKPPQATGQARADLIALVRAGEDLLNSQPFARLMAAVVDAAERDESFATTHHELTERRREPFRNVLAEAKRRGELASTADLELATDLLVGPLFYRRFIAHRPFPEGYAEAVVDGVLGAIRASGAASSGRRDSRPRASTRGSTPRAMR